MSLLRALPSLPGRHLRLLWPGPFEDRQALGFRALLPALALFGTAFAFHEPWRDEIQAWLMAGSLSLPGLLANAGTEGHPIGWHLLCQLLMAFGLPFESLYGASALCALLAALLLARRAPFPPLLRMLALCGPLILLLGIAARPYMLIVALLLLQAALFPERMRRPLAYALCLGTLSQLMVLCLPYAGLMALWWLVEILREKDGAAQVRTKGRSPVPTRIPAHIPARIPGRIPTRLLALILLWSLLLFAFWQLLPPWDKLCLMLGGRAETLSRWSAGLAFSPSCALLAAAGLAFGLFLLRALYRFHALLAFTGLACLLFALGVDTFVYPLSDCHWQTLLGMLLALGWIALGPAFAGRHGPRAGLSAALSLAALWAIFTGAPQYIREISLPSSNLPQAAAYARANLAGKSAAVHSMAKICPLLKDLPEQSFWNPVSRSWERFAVFDAQWQKQRGTSIAEVAKIILRLCPEPLPIMIFSSPWPEAGENGYELAIEFSGATVYGEDFYFYHASRTAFETVP